METQNLDASLNNIRCEKLPACPSHLADTTLRRIRQLPQPTPRPTCSGWSGIFNLFVRPQMIAMLFAIAVTVSIVSTTLANGLSREETPTHDPLGLRVLVNPASLECLPHCACTLECACNMDMNNP